MLGVLFSQANECATQDVSQIPSQRVQDSYLCLGTVQAGLLFSVLVVGVGVGVQLTDQMPYRVSTDRTCASMVIRTTTFDLMNGPSYRLCETGSSCNE